jgi:hypothetical protein
LKWRAALSPDSGATTLAKGFGPWLIILAVVCVPLIVMLVGRKK